MPKRGRLGRFVKGVTRRAKRGTKRLFNLGRGAQSGGVMGALQHPVSRIVAPAIGVTAIGELLLTPLPNGDSWLTRVLVGSISYKTSGNAYDLLAYDNSGHSAIDVALAQMKQNVLPAALTGFTAAIVGAVGRWAGA